MAPAQFLGVALVGVEAEAFGGEERELGRQRAVALDLVGQRAGFDLARFDVRLVERVDAEDRAGDGGGDLPAEELAPQRGARRHLETHHGRAGLGEARQGQEVLGVFVAVELERHEEPIGAVALGGAEGLAVDRDHRPPALAGAFGDQLLDPRADVPERGRGREGELVAAGERRGPHHAAEQEARVLAAVGGAEARIARQLSAMASAPSSSASRSAPIRLAGTSPKRDKAE